jgi:hypothetical protein
VSKKTFYGAIYSPEGEPLFDVDLCTQIFFWNDACWDRCVPENCSGLSYLDVGFHQGLYLLRFDQRGGDALGFDFNPLGGIESSTGHFDVGGEFRSEKAEEVRSMNSAQYKMRVGGFDADGKIAPKEDQKFSIVSCLNVVEYMDNTKSCVESLFEKATDRVLICTDTRPETCQPGPSPLKWATSERDLVSWCKWPCVTFKFTPKGMDAPQIWVCSTNPESKLPPVLPGEVAWDKTLKLTETQRRHEDTRRIRFRSQRD